MKVLFLGRKQINKNKIKNKKEAGFIRRRNRKEGKGEIEIYDRMMVAGVTGCKHLGNS